MKRGMPSRTLLETALDVLLQGLAFRYIAGYCPIEYLFSKTTASGDLASHYYTAQHLKAYRLPHGKILGWTQGRYAGVPVFQSYFPLPSVLMELLGRARRTVDCVQGHQRSGDFSSAALHLFRGFA